jgi:hypothetical protein
VIGCNDYRPLTLIFINKISLGIVGYFGHSLQIRHKPGRIIVYRTIIIGSCVAVQGVFLKTLANGSIAIKVGNQVFEGMPIENYAG